MKILVGLIGALFSTVLVAQEPVLNFDAATKSGVESVTPAFTWSTVPAAVKCTKSGAWSGDAPVSGSETLSAINLDATYVMTCEWAADQRATITWVNPTQNTNGTALTNLEAVIIKYRYGTGTMDESTPCTPPVSCVTVLPPIPPMAIIDGFTQAGTVNFVGLARNTAQVYSAATAPVSKTFTGIGESKQISVAITVNPRPNTLTNLGVQ